MGWQAIYTTKFQKICPESIMKRASPSLVSKGSLARIFQASGEAWKHCDFQAAIEMIERASRLNPSNAGIRVELGRLHGLRFDYAAAESSFEQAVRLAPNKSEILMAAGLRCREFNHLALAEKYFQRALEQKDASLAAVIQLAEVYERLRRPEAAAGLIDRVLHADPACAPALLVRARLDRLAGRLEEAEQRLRAFPAGTNPHLQASAAYELGSIFDRLGRYDEAMSAFLKAKGLLQFELERYAVELKIIRARVSTMIANTTVDVLRQWFADAPALQPAHRLALLGGHPRSGTTLLEQVLDSHPDIISAEETDNFYNEAYGPLLRGHPDDTAMFAGLTSATPEQLQRSRQNYFQMTDLSLGQPVAGRLLIDKNPSYTFLVPALIRIFPEIQFLIALRDPRDVVLSCFMQNLPPNQNGAACLTLASTVAEYTALMTVWQTVKAGMTNPYLEVRYEDMVADLESVARETLEFLGVPWDAKVLAFDEHARQKTVRSPTYADVTQPVYKRAVGRWRNYQKYLEPHLEKLEPFVKAFGYE
jgi:tetratricopeptide (TPR) repeat protein